MSDAMDITSLTPAMLARLLSGAYRRQITEEQVRTIAERGNLISISGTIHLLQYAAFLVTGVSHSSAEHSS